MRRSTVIALVAGVVIVLGGCGVTRSSHAARHSSGSCTYSADAVTARNPRIEMRPPGASTWRVVGSHATLPCDTQLTAADNGTADISFSGQAVCKLGQDPNLPQKIASLTTRTPRSAFFNQGAGQTWCSFPHSSTGTIPLCGMGTVFLNGGVTQVLGTCNREPDFSVEVLIGSVRVVDPVGVSYTLEAGRQLRYNPSNKVSTESAANFLASDVVTFRAQAAEISVGSLALERAPQAISFTSTPPVNPSPGQTYPVTGTGGGSGNGVIFTIDPASGKACTISPQTSVVTFTAPGTCLIDANQAGDSLFEPAPQERQTITVVAATTS